MTKNNRYLFVDLDGTLVSTDTLVESILLYCKKFPLGIWRLVPWLLKGKAYFKDQIAQRVTPDAELLPYNPEVINYINEAKRAGKGTYLATASNQRIGDSVSNHLGCFTKVIGSTDTVNLKGKEKLKAIKQIAGASSFDYIGDSKVDVPIWEASDRAIAVNPKKGLANKLQSGKELKTIVIEERKSILHRWRKVFRAHQWAKNFLLFLPVFLAHQFYQIELLINAAWAFLSFSLLASIVYVINDLFDLEADRAHPTKKNRPFAKGRTSILSGLLSLPILLFASLSIAIIFLPDSFLAILLVYFIATTLYSFFLKRVLFVDVIVLSGLYTIRIVAGAFATGVVVSSWLLVFSWFFFLSLAFMKRYADLLLMQKNQKEGILGRGYHINDLALVQKAGVTSGFVSLLVMSLYINSENVLKLYQQPAFIWLTIPVWLYWIMRMWAVANRGEMTDDPVIFAIRDKATYVVLIFIAIIMILAATVTHPIFNILQ